MVRLKAILLIDVIIVSAAAGAFFFLSNQGLIAGATTPAKFTLKDLIIDPPEVYPGEAVQISVNVTNIGDLEGIKIVNFKINNIIKDAENVTVASNSSQIVQFTDIETIAGNYNVTVDNLIGSFTIKPAPPDSSKIMLSNLVTVPYEVWVDQPVNITAAAKNPSSEIDKITIKLTVDNTIVQTQILQLDALATKKIVFTVNATSEGYHYVKINTLTGSFDVVKTGYHTLIINRNGGVGKPLPFTLNGVAHGTPYQELLPIGDYQVTVPSPYDVGTGVVQFTYWSDGVATPSRTFTLDNYRILIASYVTISGYASCPSLYVWNGAGNSYVTDVSNSGWLGYIGYINSNGGVVFNGGNPWDYVKLNNSQIAVKNINGNSYYDMTLSQQWDELFYLDAAYMVVVDHPAGTDAYTTMTNYLYKGLNEQIYTVNKTNTLSPVSATNEKGQNVLSQISKADGVYTPGNNVNLSPSPNNVTLNHLTLDLGNLSNAQQIKLVMTGIVDWGSYEAYYNWINTLRTAVAQGLLPNGTQVTPPTYMEIKALDGSWVRAPSNRQIPIPSDSNPRTFVVDLTGLFPKGASDYQIRITNSWNVTYDYIGIDTSTQQTTKIQKISPTANLSQWWDFETNSTGNFTRYGDVTPLVQNADDMFVIGRQGDQVELQFSTANLTAPEPGMTRDYFLFVACWFKDPAGKWGYGFDFTVDPLPFMAMSGFPYGSSETYPFDAVHLAYLKEYNTRVIQ
jgi:hypothetical protein